MHEQDNRQPLSRPGTGWSFHKPNGAGGGGVGQTNLVTVYRGPNRLTPEFSHQLLIGLAEVEHPGYYDSSGSQYYDDNECPAQQTKETLH